MGLNIFSELNIFAKTLQVRDQRTSLIANNLANVNTPNFKAKDIDFKQALAAEMDGTGKMQADHPGHIQPGMDFGSQLKYRIPSSASLDGNTVDKDLETSAYTRNALDYQASLSFLDGKIKSLAKAFRGE